MQAGSLGVETALEAREHAGSLGVETALDAREHAGSLWEETVLLSAIARGPISRIGGAAK